jgi:hypothetical protein
MNEMAIGDPPTNLNSLLGAIPDIWRSVNRDEAQAEMARQLALAQMQAQTNNHMAAAQQAQFPSPSLSPSPPPPATSSQMANRAREMFLKRMGGIRAEMKVAAEDYLACHIYGDQVYVFYCFGGRHGVTLESIDLFPSDQLITQFRLVLT